MCIVFWASAPPPPADEPFSSRPPAYRFILLANRDEYLERPTADMAWHDFSKTPPVSDQASGESEKQPFLCGRDLGDPTRGTWLGVGRNGRIGVLTNVHVETGTDEVVSAVRVAGEEQDVGEPRGREPEPHPSTTPAGSRAGSPRPAATMGTKSKPKSRGALIRDYLVGLTEDDRRSGAADEELPFEQLFCKRMQVDSSARYNPFNLLLFDISKLSEGITIPSSPQADQADPLGWYFSNAGPDGRSVSSRLPPAQMSGGGISNTPLDDPWPKVRDGKTGLNRLIEGMGLFEPAEDGDERDEAVVSALMDFMGQSKPVRHRSDLPTSICVPLCEIPLPQHHATPAHIAHGPHAISTDTPLRVDSPRHSAAVRYNVAERPYGTRLTTVILVRGDGEVVVVERDRLRIAKCGGEDKVVLGGKPDRVFRFRMEG